MRPKLLEPMPFSDGEWSVLERLHARFNDREAHTRLPLAIARFRAEAVEEIFALLSAVSDTAEVIESGRASGAIPEFVTKEFTDALWASQIEAQNSFANKYPAAQHITKTDAGHYVHRDDPQLVITSIQDVVDQVRSEPSP